MSSPNANNNTLSPSVRLIAMALRHPVCHQHACCVAGGRRGVLTGGDMPARCLQRCQDQVQESVPSEPSEKDIQKAQVRPGKYTNSLLNDLLWAGDST